MKTAKEYRRMCIRYWIDFDRGNINAKEYENRIESLFEQAQKEAYNQALDDAYLLGKVSYELKQSGDNPIYEYRIDKDSILKLKK